MSLPTITDPRPTLPQDAAIPPCPHFGPCGGCQLQDLTYAAQLEQKAARLRTLLKRCHPERSAQRGVEAPAVDLGDLLPAIQLHASPPLAYRNRIRLTLAPIDGQLRAGYLTTTNQQPAINNQQPSFLPITQCPIAAPTLWRAAEAFLALFNQQPATSNLQLTPDQLELCTTADESKLQLSLYLRTALKNPPAKLATAFIALCESLRTRIPELTGAGIFFLPPHSVDRSRRTEIARPGPTWGTPGLIYPVAQPATCNLQPATSYWVPRGAFFQINRYLLPEMLATAITGRSGNLAWDLYAGVGLFSRALAGQFAQVTAVEIAEPAVTALAATKLTNLRAVKATTLDFLRRAVTERDRPDLIVLDPPRTGAGRDICELLGRVAAHTLVYVSCLPETLPADLTTLAAAGYTVTELHLFDLFPQTTHIETVAILTRKPSAGP